MYEKGVDLAGIKILFFRALVSYDSALYAINLYVPWNVSNFLRSQSFVLYFYHQWCLTLDINSRLKVYCHCSLSWRWEISRFSFTHKINEKNLSETLKWIPIALGKVSARKREDLSYHETNSKFLVYIKPSGILYDGLKGFIN